MDLENQKKKTKTKKKHVNQKNKNKNKKLKLYINKKKLNEVFDNICLEIHQNQKRIYVCCLTKAFFGAFNDAWTS